MEVATGLPEAARREVGTSDAALPLQSVAWRSSLVAVLPAFTLSRAILIVTTLIAALVRRQSPMQLWDQWDAKWYLGIALHGYHWTLDGKPAVAFFPLYPLLVRAASVVVSPLPAALLLSNAFFLGALLYMHRALLQEWGESTAGRAIWLVALFPTSIFTFAPYSEGLFLLCAAAALHHAQRQQPATSALWCAAAVLTRPTGFILVPALVCFAGARRVSSWLVALGPAVFFTVLYLWYLSAQHIAPAAVLHAQRAWHRSLTYPWTGFTASITRLADHITDNPGWTIENLLQLAVTILFITVTVLACRQVGPAIAVYCTCFWVLVLPAPQWLDGYYAPLSSMDRFVLALFPLAGWIASRMSRTVSHRLFPLLGALMAGSAGVFLAGGWVG